jgi:regulator of sigma E protease
LTGPVGIVQMAQQTVKQGFHYFLTFVAVISIHLAFFNLLPIPALDGGRLMFLFTQQLLRLFGGREELGVRIEMIANLLGFFLLLGLLLFITFKDVMRLLKGFFGEG